MDFSEKVSRFALPDLGTFCKYILCLYSNYKKLILTFFLCSTIWDQMLELQLLSSKLNMAQRHIHCKYQECLIFLFSLQKCFPIVRRNSSFTLLRDPAVTGTSVLGIKFKGGVMLAA